MIKKLLLRLFLATMTLTISHAAEQTTGNLITNGNFETGNANGWTTQGDVQVLNDCCQGPDNLHSQYDLEFGNSGSINQDFSLTSESITQPMLNNGITLNSKIEVQNGECGVAGCWGGSGPADTFTNTLTIKDNTGNILATVTQSRTNVTGISGQNFIDQLIYTGVGSNVGNINIGGSDANAPANLGGPNIDNISVTMLYDDTVLPPAIETHLIGINEGLVTEFRELENVVELREEIKFRPIELSEPEEIVNTETFEFTAIPLEEPKEQLSIVTTKPMMITSKEKEPKAEEVETFTGMFSMLPTEKKEEPTSTETSATIEEKEEVNQIEKKEKQETKSVSQASTKSTIQTTKTKEQKAVQQKKAIEANLGIIMDKVDEQIKDIDKNLQVKNVIKLKAMMDNAKLALYQKPFYKDKKIYENQPNILDNRLIYKNNLSNYIQNDPVVKHQNNIIKIKEKKQKLLRELDLLKNG